MRIFLVGQEIGDGALHRTSYFYHPIVGERDHAAFQLADLCMRTSHKPANVCLGQSALLPNLADPVWTFRILQPVSQNGRRQYGHAATSYSPVGVVLHLFGGGTVVKESRSAGLGAALHRAIDAISAGF
jgi:hypothetical protein